MSAACSIDGCESPVVGHGWCSAHWQRWRRWGDPLGAQIKRPTADRFFEKVAFSSTKRFNGTPCLEWQAFRNLDYGQFQLANQKPVRAHRWLYEHWVGPIPEGLVLDHLCRNPPCCNPAHLEPVTQAENVRRAAPYRHLVSHCPQGHAYDEANTIRGSKGERICHACSLDTKRRYKRRKLQEKIAAGVEWGLGAHNRSKTECPQGHPYDLVEGDGRRRCSICQREVKRLSAARVRARKKVA